MTGGVYFSLMNAVKIKCEYCETLYEAACPRCPACGAANPSYAGAAGGSAEAGEGTEAVSAPQEGTESPGTIEELQRWYRARNLPPEEVTRFFIGKDVSEPRAFGIFKDDSGDFVVYKNKSDGSRAMRYRGPDERYAVNELYQKLKDEILNQKSHQAGARGQSGTATDGRGKRRFGIGTVIVILAIAFNLYSFARPSLPSNNGYYQYRGDTYYRYDMDWYIYDHFSGWRDVESYGYTIPDEVYNADRNSEYYRGSSWDSSLNTTDWNNSEYHERYETSDSDSAYDWDSNDSWDSGNTDWDSDW